MEHSYNVLHKNSSISNVKCLSYSERVYAHRRIEVNLQRKRGLGTAADGVF